MRIQQQIKITVDDRDSLLGMPSANSVSNILSVMFSTRFRHHYDFHKPVVRLYLRPSQQNFPVGYGKEARVPTSSFDRSPP